MEAMDRRHSRGRISLILAMCAALLCVTLIGYATGRSDAAPPTDTSPCSKRVTVEAFDAFIGAFNRGDGEALDALFAEQPEFEWYSSPRPGRRLGRAAKNRDTLVAYFASRHEKKDRMHLRSFHFTGNSPHYSNFWFQTARRAVGFRGGEWYRTGGKGAAICVDGQAQIIVMSHGGPESKRSLAGSRH